MINSIRIAAALAACWMGLCSAADEQTNPNDRVADAAFAVHGAEFSADLQKKAMDSYDLAKRKLFDYLEKEAKGDLQKIQADDVGTTYVHVTRLRRAALQLQLLGEPAGAEFELRADVMHSHLGRLAGAITSFPATQKYIAAFRQWIARSDSARAKLVAEIGEKAQRKQWAAAETELYKIYDRLEVGTIYLSYEEKKPIYQPFVPVDEPIVTAMNEIRSAKVKQILQLAHKETLPHYSTLVTGMNMAIESLETKDTAPWKGEQLSAPQLVTKFAETWREAQWGALKAQGIAWALQHRRDAEPTSSTEAADAGAAKAAEDYNAFSRLVMACFSRLIDVETARQTSDDVSGTYVEFLRTLAPVVRETNNTGFATSLNLSLAKLRAKNTTLDQQTTAYEAATDDLLRWRARVAATRAAQQAKVFAPVEQRMLEGTMSKDDFTGLFTEGAGAARPAQLMSPAADVIVVAAKRLVGQKATARDVVRFPGDSKDALARYASRTCAAVPVPLSLGPEVESLGQDLFISADAPPLTLNAMRAHLTAQRGDMMAVGGDIAGIQLEAVITLFATMRTETVALTELGKFPTELVDSSGLTHVLMRFHITPRWAQHDYFFVQLAPPVEATASLQ